MQGVLILFLGEFETLGRLFEVGVKCDQNLRILTARDGDNGILRIRRHHIAKTGQTMTK